MFKRKLGGLDLTLVETLFDRMPDCPFFIKDQNLQYVAANAAMLTLCGVKRKDEMLGQTVSAFFPKATSFRYENMDREILKTGKGLIDRLEIIHSKKSPPVWLHFSRLPVTDEDGKVVGIVGTSRQFRVADRQKKSFHRLGKIISHIQENYQQPLNLNALTEIAGVSKSQIERDFMNLFRMTPQQYLNQVRLNRAVELLEKDISVAEIAFECGYADHSAFTRRFKMTMGITPTYYRKDLKAGI